MRKIIFFLFLWSLMACSNEKVDAPTVLSGQFDNLNGQPLTISALDYSHDLVISADGKFSDTLDLPDLNYYNLSVGRSRVPIYLKKGNSITITASSLENIKFGGELAAENQLMRKLISTKKAVVQNPNKFYGLEETAFIAANKALETTMTSMINSAAGIDAQFKEDQIQDVKYGYAADINNYEAAHAYYTKNPNFMASEAYNKELVDIDLNNVDAFKSSENYKNLLAGNLQKNMTSAYEESKDYNKAIKAAVSEIDNKLIRSEMLKNYAAMLLAPNEDLTENYDFLITNTDTEKYKKDYTDTFNRLKSLSKGQPSPQFVNYENHKGGQTSLSDLKGKYVYVDVWATWCGPCKREIPSLKAVEKEFHEKNIEFVSTSIDRAKDHAAWVKMVNDKDLGGTQLMADNNWKSKFVTDYQITGIPRFILIDPNGNIVSADAPRPSDPKLKTLLNELDI